MNPHAPSTAAAAAVTPIVGQPRDAAAHSRAGERQALQLVPYPIPSIATAMAATLVSRRSSGALAHGRAGEVKGEVTRNP